ncbi:hypothetical protein PHAVU_006G054466 [Phaseolus vulgaris]
MTHIVSHHRLPTTPSRDSVSHSIQVVDTHQIPTLQNQSLSKPCPLGFPCQFTTHSQPPLPTPHPNVAQKPAPHFPNLFSLSHPPPHHKNYLGPPTTTHIK